MKKRKRIWATPRNSNVALLSTEAQSLRRRPAYHQPKGGGKIRTVGNPQSRWSGVFPEGAGRLEPVLWKCTSLMEEESGMKDGEEMPAWVAKEGRDQICQVRRCRQVA